MKILHNVEIWAASPNGHWTVLNEYRAENAAVVSHDDLERLRTRAYAALSEWRKVFPYDKIEIVMVTRSRARRRQRREKIAEKLSRHHRKSFSMQHIGEK